MRRKVARVPTTNLVLDLDAARGVFTDTARTTQARFGDLVAGWADQSGQGNHASQSTSGNRFRLAVDSRGVPVLRSLHGTTVANFMTVADAATLQPGTGALTAIVVARCQGDANYYLIAKGNSTSVAVGYSMFVDAAGPTFYGRACTATADRASQGYTFPNAAAADSGPAMYRLTLSGSAVTGLRNESATGWTSGGGGPSAGDNTYSGSINNTDAMSIGQSGLNTFYFEGDIYRVLIYQGSVSAGDLAAIYASLNAAYRFDLYPAPAAAMVTPSSAVTVFSSGTGYTIYRIPALVAAGSTVVAFAEGRASLADSGNIDLVCKRSTDNGATWGSNIVIAGGSDSNTWGNPSPIYDAARSRLHLIFCWNNGSDTEAQIKDGTSIDTRRVYYTYSTDAGSTWAAAVEITSQVKPSGSRWYATGPGSAVVTASGRLVVGANYTKADQTQRTHFVYSDDGGTTWTQAAFADGNEAANGTTEVTITICTGGKLYATIRDQSGPYRMYCESWDDGATWTQPVADPPLTGTPCQGDVRQVGSWLAQAYIPARNVRQNGHVVLSADGGRSWVRRSRFGTTGTQYSDLELLPNGRAGILAEDSSLSAPVLRFTAFDLP